MKKKSPAKVFISTLLFSALAGMLFSNTAQANPYKWETIPPPTDVKAPTITLISPENNTIFQMNNIILNCVARVEDSTIFYRRVHLLLNYKADWLQNETMKVPIQDDNNDGLVKILLTLTDIPDGKHSIIIEATEVGQIITEAKKPITGLIQEFYITSFILVNFIVDTAPPTISFLSLENKTYYTPNIPLDFIVNEPVSQISYVLNGQENVTISGNTTLTGLSYGAHNLTVYAVDVAGNTGVSETITFTVAPPTSFPTEPIVVVVACAALAAFTGYRLIVYFKKRKHQALVV